MVYKHTREEAIPFLASNIGDTIFSLMGFPENSDSDRVYELYLELTKKARFLNLSESQNQLEQLAQEIYKELTLHRSTLNIL